MDNSLAAQLLFQHGYATQEQILEVWPLVGTEGHLPEMLCRRGVISEATRDQLVGYLLSLSAASEVAPPPPKPSPPQELILNEIVPAKNRVEAPVASAREEGFFLHWLRQGRTQQVSDLHLCAGLPVHWRRNGRLEPAGSEALSRDQSEAAVREALGEKDWEVFVKRGDMEAMAEWPGLGRVRITALKQRRGFDLTARLLPLRIPTFEELGLPESCRELTRWTQGLVLVTGPAGCGKSTTLAALVQMLNQTRREHILTIEDPIEILFPTGTCQVTQRQVGKHTRDRNAALRAALREDPDVLVISELRDLESIQLAVSAAETGHLVFGAMNTNNATRTIYRLIDSFPPEEQGIIRNMVSESLRGILAQQLLPRRDGGGVVPAFEVLMVNSAVANLIRKDEAHQLGTAMITGKSSGMVLLDDSLRQLVEQGLVEPEEAWKRAVQPRDFERYFKAH